MYGCAALAQGTAVLTGTVADASTKAPIADVVVTATSRNLQGEQVVVTDATGLYRIPQLPPGDYTLRLEKEGYKPFSRSGIPVKLDRTLRVNIELLPESLKAEEIVVVGRPPTIDVGSSNTGVTVSTEFIRNIAVVRPGSKGSAARSFESLAEIAPTANADTYGVSVNGTTSPENQFIIDGLSVNDPGFGLIGTPLSVEFIQQVNVITGGYMPEYGRATGGIMNAVTKSGSNEFHGSVWGNLTPGAIEGSQPRVLAEGSTLSVGTKLWNLGDFGAEVGGPILKDKLWFYAGLAPSATRYRVQRLINFVQLDASGAPIKDPDTGFTQVTNIPEATQNYFADQRSLQYIGKLTYLINQDHNVSLSVYGTPTTSGGGGTLALNPRTGQVQTTTFLGPYEAIANKWTSVGNDVALKWSSSFLDKRILLDASVGWHHQLDQRLPSDGTPVGSQDGLGGIAGVIWRRTAPHSITDFESFPGMENCDLAGTASAKLCPVTLYNSGGPGFINDASLDRYQGKVVGTYLLRAVGHHVIKAGIDVEVMTYLQKKAYTGRDLFREATNGATFQDFRQYGYLSAPDTPVVQDFQQGFSRSNTVGGFLQDSWNVLDLFTVNAGLRYDAQTLIGSTNATAIVLANEVSPRIGVIYDFTRSGRSKLFANYARYFESAPLDMIDRAFPAERRITVTRRFAPNAATGAPGCNPLDPEQQDTVCQDPKNFVATTSASEANRFWSARGGGGEAVDGNLQPQSSDEIVLGGEYEVIPDGRIGVSFTRRYMNRVIEDMSRDEATTYFIGNPGYGISQDFPVAQRDYNGLTVYFDKTFSDLWLGQISYTFSNLYGNYPGLFRPETGQLDPNINSDFDLISLMANRSGPLPGDSTHQLKIFGAKEFPLGAAMSLNIGASYRGRTGYPLSVLGSHPLYGPREVFILPRGAGGRLPWNQSIDGHVGFNYKLGRDTLVSLTLDVFNLLNFAGVTAKDQEYTRADVLPIENGTKEDLASLSVPVNPNYGNPTQYQDPRRIRFGMKVTF